MRTPVLMSYIENLSFDIFDRIVDQHFDSFSTSIGHKSTVDVFNFSENFIHFQFFDKRSNRLQNKFDVVDGVALLDAECYIGFRI